MRLTPGTRVGPYEVLSLVGAGGMAEVYRARDSRLGREVALKVCSEALGSDAQLFARLQREARLAGSLNHVNVVAVHDVGLHDGYPYFVSELLDGETLRQRMARGAVPLPRAVTWMAQAAAGLAAAHDRGIVHRDLKPENLFVTRDGSLKVLDFGIAKPNGPEAPPSSRDGLLDPTVPSASDGTGTGVVLGTPGYMSPEQVRGDAVDPRTDIFSLGAVLYELMVGQRAFPGTMVESSYAILHNEPPPLPPRVPPFLGEVVRRCLEKDPGRRIQSARDLAFALEAAPKVDPDLAPPAVHRPALRTVLGWVAAILVASCAAGLASVVLSGRAEPGRPRVRQVTFRRGMVSGARFAPDGRIFYSAIWGSERENLFSTAPGTAEAFTLNVRSAELLGVSRNGELLVSMDTVWPGPGGGGGTLASVPAVGGVPRAIAEPIVFADAAPSGEVAVIRRSGLKWQLEFPIGKVLYTTTAKLGPLRVAPDGSSVAFATGNDDSSVLLLADRTGGVRELSKLNGYPSGLAWNPTGREVWYSEGNAISSVSRDGRARLIYQAIESLSLEDVSAASEALVTVSDDHGEVAYFSRGAFRTWELPGLDNTFGAELSEDGKRILLTGSPSEKLAPLVYVQPTDGATPLKLGSGAGLSLSPDGRYALVNVPDETDSIAVVPVGVGAPRNYSTTLSYVGAARWFRDGERVALVGRRDSRDEPRIYVLDLASGRIRQVSDEVVLYNWMEVSRDSKFIAAAGDTIKLYPLDGGPPRALPGLHWMVPVGWTPSGQLWVSDMIAALTSREHPPRLFRYDLKTGALVSDREILPPDPAGLVQIVRISVSDDGQSVAYAYERKISTLYLVSGLDERKR